MKIRKDASTPVRCSPALIILVVLALGLLSATAAQQIRYGEQPGAAQRTTLLLRDYQPRSMLHLTAHPVQKARFPVWDVHNHVDDARGIGDPIPVPQLIRNMDEVNVARIVILTGGFGAALQKVLDNTAKPHPDRFIVFTELNWKKVNDPNFGQEMAQQIDDSVARGARGLKLLKDFGLGVRTSDGKLLRLDDKRLDPVWEECGKLGIPVFIHTTDPEAFFTPINAHNERYEELKANPTWSFYDHGFPTKQELLEERNRVIERHPHTTFAALHVANWPENLDVVGQWLDKYPNMMVEFGARQAELGRQPRRARKFFEDYQDRIMFGTDSEPVPAMYRNYFRWLETEDEYFDYWGYPGQGRWEIYGEGLPDGILEKVYHLNAERVFSQFHGVSAQ
jgi:predicted TIM-barrel fold metal-dependent hydrolase